MPPKPNSFFSQEGRFDVARFQDAVLEACRQTGFKCEKYGTQERFPLISCERKANSNSTNVYMSTGMHGDEPAGPLALFRILEEGLLPHSMNFVICPLLNPVGLSLGTRENGSGVDLNRDYSNPSTLEVKAHTALLDRQPPFDLAILMHEDCDSPGFYLNDFVCTEQSAAVAQAILASVTGECPVNTDPIIDTRPARDGVACTWEDEQLKKHWTECFYLRKNETAYCFNFESPSQLPLETRIAGQVAATKRALDLLT